ncbi:MAG: DEAD/DEAH box helicase [Cyanobacteria bacterium P01_D01_bin.1]
MILPPSNSSHESLEKDNSKQQASSGFYQLNSGMQRWIWKQNWPSLRPIQEQAIPLILPAKTDVIISAATAGGKTEAAFLPIFSHIADLTKTADLEKSVDLEKPTGIQALCISPLKALINDQYRRLSAIGEDLEIAVTPWHGDVDAGKKKRLLKKPSGILIITPESLEALLIRQGSNLSVIFSALNYLVVDELHAFIGSERGKQLQSLMHRVEQGIHRHIPRIGLSATIGDMQLAAEFLRPQKAEGVALIESDEEGQEIRIQVRGYVERAPELKTKAQEKKTEQDEDQASEDKADQVGIATHLFKTLRGDTNLIFINSRSGVEIYTDLLRRLCEQQRVPNEFFPHHGSLSKAIREEAEQALKSDKPSNVICTTTLEMGIDVGSVKSIAQVGAPFSVSSTRQRLGRSGRNEGEPAIVRFYLSEKEVTPQTPIQDSLHPALIQTIAIVNLMIFEKWCEPPVVSKLHLSTLIQQALSLIAQYGGVSPLQLWQVLCQTGAFHQVDQALFMKLLKQLGYEDLIQQTHDGLLLLGVKGEKIVNHYSFYTAFKTPEEYRIVTRGKTLGTLPIDFPLTEGMFMIFAGRRWKIIAVDAERKVVDVARSPAGKVPSFAGSGGGIHNKIRQEMRRIYGSTDVPVFLDREAVALLQEARENFHRAQLNTHSLVSDGDQTLMFCWMGSRVTNTIQLMLSSRGLAVGLDGVAITVYGISKPALMAHLQTLVKQGPVEALQLASVVKDKTEQKHDLFLSEELLCWNYASSHISTQLAWETLNAIVAR